MPGLPLRTRLTVASLTPTYLATSASLRVTGASVMHNRASSLHMLVILLADRHLFFYRARSATTWSAAGASAGDHKRRRRPNRSMHEHGWSGGDQIDARRLRTAPVKVRQQRDERRVVAKRGRGAWSG